MKGREIMKLWEIMGELQTIFSPKIAEDWDNVGLLIGDNTKEVNKVLFCLDVTQKAVQKAIDKNVDLIKYAQENNIIFIGFNIFETELHLAIKAFSLEGLLLFTERFFKYCEKEKIVLENKKNLKWMQLENYILPSEKLKHNFLCDSFLEKTLDERFFSIFIKLFQEFDSYGYINSNSLKEKVVLKEGHPQEIRNIDQISRFFLTSSKLTIRD